MSIATKIKGIREVWQFENRASLVISKTLFPREQLHIYRYKGLDILVDHAAGDANGAREVLTSPMYRRFLPLMKLGSELNVLDLGGNNGGFPLLLQAENHFIKKVVSVELNPKTFVRLEFNLKRNLRGKTVLLNAALTGTAGTLELRLGGGDVNDNIYETGSDAGEVYQLPGITLDQVIADHFAGEIVDICKIDVEGTEFDVFLEPHHNALKNCRYLIMEIHETRGHTAAEILPIIENLGFSHQPFPPDADQSVHFFINSVLNN